LDSWRAKRAIIFAQRRFAHFQTKGITTKKHQRDLGVFLEVFGVSHYLEMENEWRKGRDSPDIA